MIVYFVTQKNMGSEVTLIPRIPKSSLKDEGDIPRICVSTSILGALSSIGRNICFGCSTFVYSCDANFDEIIQPNNVHDVDYTGELWILSPKKFTLWKTLELEKVHSFTVDDTNEIEISQFEFRELV